MRYVRLVRACERVRVRLSFVFFPLEESLLISVLRSLAVVFSGTTNGGDYRRVHGDVIEGSFLWWNEREGERLNVGKGDFEESTSSARF